MNKYTLKWLKQLIDQLPTSLRRPKLINWLWALLVPLRWLGDRLIEFRDLIRDEISRNGQEISLEKILNDRFDTVQRRIYIDDEQVTVPQALWLIVEAQQEPFVWLISEIPTGSALDLKTISEHGKLGVFIIYIPTGMAFDMAALAALVNKYKLAGLQWKIEYF